MTLKTNEHGMVIIKQINQLNYILSLVLDPHI